MDALMIKMVYEAELQLLKKCQTADDTTSDSEDDVISSLAQV